MKVKFVFLSSMLTTVQAVDNNKLEQASNAPYTVEIEMLTTPEQAQPKEETGLSPEALAQIEALLNDVRPKIQVIIEQNSEEQLAQITTLESEATEIEETDSSSVIAEEKRKSAREKRKELEGKIVATTTKVVEGLLVNVKEKAPIVEREIKRITEQFITKVDDAVRQKKVERETKRIAEQAQQVGKKVENETKKFLGKLGLRKKK